MSSIQKVPVEILLDIFEATDPAGTEALRLTCRHFNTVSLQNLDALPMRLVCDLYCDTSSVLLYRAPANNESTRGGFGRETRNPIARGIPSRTAFNTCTKRSDGNNTAIRHVEVRISYERDHVVDEPLMQLTEHFPAVKCAVSLNISDVVYFLPTDAAPDHFKRLETIAMNTCWVEFDDEKPLFWRAMFARNSLLDDRELFDFIVDRSLMPEDRPRVDSIGRLPDGILELLKHRFDKNIASIGGQVCATTIDHEGDAHYITNMAFSSEKESLAERLLSDVIPTT